MDATAHVRSDDTLINLARQKTCELQAQAGRKLELVGRGMWKIFNRHRDANILVYERETPQDLHELFTKSAVVLWAEKALTVESAGWSSLELLVQWHGDNCWSVA